MSGAYKPDAAGIEKLQLALSFGLLNLGLAIEGDAKRRCPYRTGNLRRSIHTAAFNRGRRIYGGTDENGKQVPDYAAGQKGQLAVVGTNCGYGVFLELGTIHMSAQPYLGPALADNRPRAAGLVRAGMQRVLGGGGGTPASS